MSTMQHAVPSYTKYRRLAVAVMLMPLTVPFVLFCEGWEWFHFKISNPLVHKSRRARDWMYAFFDKQESKASASVANTLVPIALVALWIWAIYVWLG